MGVPRPDALRTMLPHEASRTIPSVDPAPATPRGAAPVAAAPEHTGVVGIVAELVKARLTALVLVTTAAGFILAMPGAIDWAKLGWTVVGTAFAAASASMLNQLAEIARDGRMRRTRNRPLPARRVGRIPVFVAGVLLGYLGAAVLLQFTNALAAGLALGNLLLYVLVYTPLKPRTTLNTIVGAVTGAVPPLIGWAAAAGSLHQAAWVLGGILFVWQLPHFLALAWMYRDDYALGGFQMLPAIDRDGRITSLVTLAGSLLLVPLGLLGVRLGVAGWWYGIASVVLAGWMILRSVQMWRDHSIERARAVFMASLLYLPLLLGVMVLDRGPVSLRAWADGGRPLEAIAAPPIPFEPPPRALREDA
jgi:protoheme IX farnesyltransferase